ncbi:NUDIX hydrolase [Amycolatopsis sp. NPDC051071]|uniref:NUDIX hydrolase n=1 Tax=Amycolatopsis sp. NPDC051071 TaxID=3154637 RepID=UPI003430A10D
MVTVDLVILTIRGSELCVLLMEQRNEPFRGRMAFLYGDKSLEQTAARELAEKAGFDAEALKPQQVGVHSAPNRDRRRPRVVTCATLRSSRICRRRSQGQTHEPPP